jgi:hypothetical protein
LGLGLGRVFVEQVKQNAALEPPVSVADATIGLWETACSLPNTGRFVAHANRLRELSPGHKNRELGQLLSNRIDLRLGVPRFARWFP